MVWMPEATDIALVREYCARQSEPAFETLVHRHVNLVYSMALRRVGNPAQAEEITQAVFVILARKAARLRPDVVLAAWLHETARHVAASFLRGEIRRRRREQEAYMRSTLQPSSDDSAWEQLAPLLDEAIGRLRSADRNVVALRYFQNKSVREIAAALNIGEAAAKKRLTRAVEKLRLDFFKRGINVSTAALSGAVLTHSIQTAPAQLTASILAAAKGATISASTLTLIKGALKIMAWTKVKTAIVIGVAAILAASTTGVVGYKIVQTNRHTANFSLEDDIQPDGTIYARVTVEIINTTRRTVTPKEAWTMNNGIDIQRLTDDAGQPMQFTRKPAPNGQFQYNSFLTRSVPPGKKFAAKLVGTIDGIGTGMIKSTGGPGVFEVQDGEQASVFAMHCTYNYRLPPGAVLLDKSPSLKEVTSGGRIEMRFDQVLPPRAKAAYHFRYRLPAQAN